MKTLHLYLLRQVLAAVLLTVTVFTFVLLLGNVLREVFTLLVNRQATLGLVVEAIALLIPFALVFALPMGMLTGTLLVFGRLSADQELTAVRAGGVSLVAWAAPVLALALALSGLCAWINLSVAPQCRAAYRGILGRMATAQAADLLPEGRFVTSFPGYVIYAGKRDGERVKDLLISKLDASGNVELRLRAAEGRMVLDAAARRLRLELADVQSLARVGEEWRPMVLAGYEVELDLKAASERARAPRLSDMGYTQLREKIRELEGQGLDSTPAQYHLQRKVAFSFACVGFTLVGIPLGIRAHRRESSAGMGIALVLALLYYSVIVLTQSLETQAALRPQLLVWLPNFAFQGVGAVLLWRANRGA